MWPAYDRNLIEYTTVLQIHTKLSVFISLSLYMYVYIYITSKSNHYITTLATTVHQNHNSSTKNSKKNDKRKNNPNDNSNNNLTTVVMIIKIMRTYMCIYTYVHIYIYLNVLLYITYILYCIYPCRTPEEQQQLLIISPVRNARQPLQVPPLIPKPRNQPVLLAGSRSWENGFCMFLNNGLSKGYNMPDTVGFRVRCKAPASQSHADTIAVNHGCVNTCYMELVALFAYYIALAIITPATRKS